MYVGFSYVVVAESSYVVLRGCVRENAQSLDRAGRHLQTVNSDQTIGVTLSGSLAVSVSTASVRPFSAYSVDRVAHPSP